MKRLDSLLLQGSNPSGRPPQAEHPTQAKELLPRSSSVTTAGASKALELEEKTFMWSSWLVHGEKRILIGPLWSNRFVLASHQLARCGNPFTAPTPHGQHHTVACLKTVASRGWSCRAPKKVVLISDICLWIFVLFACCGFVVCMFASFILLVICRLTCFSNLKRAPLHCSAPHLHLQSNKAIHRW